MPDPPDDDDESQNLVPLHAPSEMFSEDETPAPGLWPAHDIPSRFANPDWMRGILAAILIVTFCIVAIVSLVLVALAKNADNVTKSVALVFGALGTITGAVSGFYFGGRGHHK
jgi:hypothetical protein